MIVSLDVPVGIEYQLVYRLQRDEPSGCPVEAPLQFVLLNSLREALSWRSAIARVGGLATAAKTFAKLTTGSRSLYLVTLDGQAVSYGWGTVGRCKYYKIEPEAIVIGPIWTAPETRGRGFATIALQAAIDAYIRRGRTLFYIDTSRGNTPAQRVFQKCGFRDPVALYFR